MQSVCAVFYCRLWPVRLYHILPHYPIKVTIFGGEKEVVPHIIRDLIFSTSFVCNISHSKKKWTREDHVYWSSCKLAVILVRFSWKWNILDRFSKNSKICLLTVIRRKTAVNVTEYYQGDEIRGTATEGARYAKEGVWNVCKNLVKKP